MRSLPALALPALLGTSLPASGQVGLADAALRLTRHPLEGVVAPGSMAATVLEVQYLSSSVGAATA